MEEKEEDNNENEEDKKDDGHDRHHPKHHMNIISIKGIVTLRVIIVNRQAFMGLLEKEVWKTFMEAVELRRQWLVDFRLEMFSCANQLWRQSRRVNTM